MDFITVSLYCGAALCMFLALVVIMHYLETYTGSKDGKKQ